MHLEKVIARNHTKDPNFNLAMTILQTFGANEVDINEFKNLIETPSFMNLSTFANVLQLQSEVIMHVVTPHSRNGDLGVLRDSRNFRVQLQGSKHLALRRSSCHWKVIEMEMSKMASHEPFGHLQHKLWQKEGPKVKLAI